MPRRHGFLCHLDFLPLLGVPKMAKSPIAKKKRYAAHSQHIHIWGKMFAYMRHVYNPTLYAPPAFNPLPKFWTLRRRIEKEISLIQDTEPMRGIQGIQDSWITSCRLLAHAQYMWSEVAYASCI